MKRKNTLMKRVLILFVCLIICELYLRYNLGMCDAPLYCHSDSYEYIAAPNQNGKRFGNRYHINSFSQRSEEPDSTKVIILGLGDSILFGGSLTDQDSLATSLITNNKNNFQVLNISAGSWGPDNCAAYLTEKGVFDAQAMFLVASSHDAYDNMSFKRVVGVHPAYPEKKFSSAFAELITRYIFPKINKVLTTTFSLNPNQMGNFDVEIKKNGVVFNSGFDQLKQIAEKANIPFFIYLHADKSECTAQRYNQQGQKIIEWADSNEIDIILDLDQGIDITDYRDVIHINNSGQKKLAKVIRSRLNTILGVTNS